MSASSVPGIAGLTTAYLLLAQGKTVIVVDEGTIGSGQTGRTSAHLASAIDDRFIEIEKLHGKKGAKLAYESHAAAIDRIEQITKNEKIRCDFKRLDAFLSKTESDPANLLDRELAAARRAGFTACEIVSNAGMNHDRCIRFPNQARFQPMEYLTGLMQAIQKQGGKIHTGQRVIDVQGADLKKGTPAVARLRGGLEIQADSIVVATNTPSPVNNWMGIYTKQAAYRTYVVALSIPRGSVPDALFWDTADPYHYVRLQPLSTGNNDLLLVGGEDHKTGQLDPEATPFLNLETWAWKKFPTAGASKFRWSGQVQESADGLGFIGTVPTSNMDHVYTITGDSGMGLTHGTLGAMLITDLITEKKNPWADLYDPNRKELNSEFIKENANTLAQYKTLVTPGEVVSVRDIPKGSGAILRKGASKLAVYRDDDGKLCKRSAVCTHLQCIVAWNPIEKTWDCPAHGSRFDPCGKVVIGPAIDDLAAVK